jgi:phenylalanyl-tRNA synthetase beta chain
MKLIYSEIKKLLPELAVTAKQLRDDLTMIGHFASGYEEIGDDVVLDLEIRQNRADCLGYYGIARELSVLYSLDLELPKTITPQYNQKSLPVNINSSDVHRILATKISNIKNSPSPDWLKKFLSLHDVNSINTLVDLTNYIMLVWGIPCHAFDTAKISSLTWENNHKKNNTLTTLDGTNLKLTDNCLLITDNSRPVSLSFIGGQNSGIKLNTTETIIEMAIYNRSRVRTDSRTLKTITEASIRLDKELDTDTIPLAFNHLVALIQEHCNGQINSELLDVYPQKPEEITIPFDSSKPSQYTGINITPEFSKNVFNKLGCIKKNSSYIPPSIRKDISIEEDLIEEVVRFYGYNKIPVDQPINNSALPDITPKIIYLIEKIKDDLITQGYDEIRSWPLTRHCEEPRNEAISTENSINSEYPYLRQSIIQSLKSQLEQYDRYKLPNPKFFEIGKIYYQENGKYVEKYSLATYDDKKFSETILNDLPTPDSYIPSSQNNTAVELTSQIITLDANVNLDAPQDPISLIKKYSALIDKKILWSMEIIDIYQSRYTFRVHYYNCDDKTAKKVHLKTFDLL